jgi:PAS domain S-box-containing protein
LTIHPDGGTERKSGLAAIRPPVAGELSSVCEEREPARVEQDSGAANDMLRVIFDHVPAGMELRGLDGRYLHVNASVARALGAAPQELVGREPAEHHDPATAAMIAAQDEEMRRTRRPLTEDQSVRHADGSEHDYLVLRYPVLDDQGRVSAFGALSLDVTDRRRAERELRDAERRFRMLLEAAPDAIVIVDLNGLIALVNARTEELFGFAREELLGQPVEMLMPAAARDRHVDRRRRYTANPHSRQLEVTGLRKDGSEFPAQMTLSGLATDGGVLIVSALRDITSQRVAAEAIARLAAVVSSSHEAIIAKTLDGVITDWNPAAERMYGYRAQEAIGMPTSMLLASEDQHAELREILQRVRDGEAIELVTTRRHQDQRVIDVELTISPIRDPHGRIVGASTVGRDITERKHTQEALRRSQERLEQAEAVAQMGSWEWDLRTDRVSWSAGLYKLFELAPETADRDIEHGLRHRVHPEDRERMRETLERAVSQLESVSTEYRAIRADGHMRIHDWRADPIVDETGKPVRVIGVVHDITDTRRTQQALSAASSNLAKYVQELQQLAVGVGADGDHKPLQAALSARQIEVLHLVAEGLTNEEIGKRMFIATGTVKWHIKQILTKTNSTNRTEAVARVIGADRRDTGRRDPT